jgi:enamine deaminase RidA (YjgF/YER057c/UK114 family)
VTISQRIDDLGLVLPAAASVGVQTTFSWVRVVGDRVLVSGHGPLQVDGKPSGPFGRVPDEVSLEEAQESARMTALAVFSSVQGVLGDLDRVGSWLTVSGFVNAKPGFGQTTAVLNAFSEVVLSVFGATIGEHARTAIGVSALPLNLPVVVAAELVLRG